jgi:hypothetical protein
MIFPVGVQQRKCGEAFDDLLLGFGSGRPIAANDVRVPGMLYAAVSACRPLEVAANRSCPKASRHARVGSSVIETEWG